MVFSSAGIGGAERSLTRMAAALRDQNPEIHCTLSTLNAQGEWAEFSREAGFEPLCFGVGGYRTMLRNIRCERYDVVYVMGLRLSFWTRLLKPFLKGAKLIHGIRWSPEGDSRLDKATRLVEQRLGFLIDHYITNAQAAADVLTDRCRIAAQKTDVIYNGITLPKAAPPSYSERPMHILTIANLAPRKGYLEYLDVIERVYGEHPEAQFHFIGKDTMDGKLQAAIAARGLQAAITYHGFCADVSEHLANARLFVLPAQHSEGCPTAMLEAMSYAIPVCGYRINGVAELVEEGSTGLLAGVSESELLGEHISALLQDKTRAQTMGEAGYARVKEHFTLAQCAAKHAEVFAKCVA